ncbi:MAG: methionyl-tRNA formyltransferase [bacterium]|nr:methionyl-tRNA formyltransferase [bacterium]
MRIVFMGTPEFACRPMQYLCQSDHELLAVVTGVDKKSGRGKKVQATPVCDTACQVDIPVIKAASLKSDELYAQLEALKADLFVVIAFRILPQRLINLPKLGAINIHASLLPKYRGAAPINWALINGERETGLTSFYLKKSVDTGDIIHQQKITIHDGENFDSLYDRLSEISGPFLLETLEKIEQAVPPTHQDESEASPAPKLSPFDGMIDFGMPAAQVVNFVRGLSTRPAAYTFFRGHKLKVYRASLVHDIEPDRYGDVTRPGTLVPDKKRLLVTTADRPVELAEVVPEGKKPMDGRSFINGQQPKAGEVFGEIESGAKEKT